MTDFQQDLADALAGEGPVKDRLAAVRGLAKAYIGGPKFLPDTAALATAYPNLYHLAVWLLERSSFDYEALNQAKTDLSASQADTETLEHLWDNLVALELKPQNPVLRDHLVKMLQVHHLLAKGLDQDPPVSDQETLFILSQAYPVLPKPIFPLPRLPLTEPTLADNKAAADLALVKAQVEQLAELQAGIRFLETLYESRVQAARAFRDKWDYQFSEEEEPWPEPPLGTVTPSNFETLDETAWEALDQDWRDFLSAQDLGPGQAIREQKRQLEEKAKVKLQILRQHVESRDTVIQTGGSLWLKRAGLADEPVLPADTQDMGSPYDDFYGSDGACKPLPLGVIDLKVLKQTFKCYKIREIAHIENVLAGESKTRQTRRLRRQEDETFQSTERIEESERDTQTTERYELSREIASESHQSRDFSIGAQVMGSYGPISASVNTNFGTQSSSSQSERQAENFARETTKRASLRLVNRILEERRRKVVEEFEENNEHKVENPGPEHIVGTYHWLEACYDAHVENYGKHLMFSLTIPEPAAFFFHAQEQAQRQLGAALQKPIDPLDEEAMGARGLLPLRNHQYLSAQNYALYAAVFQVDLAPPPPEFKRLGMRPIQLPDNAEGKGGLEAKAVDDGFEIPEGYEAHKAYFRFTVAAQRIPLLGSSSLILAAMTLQVGHSRVFYQTPNHGSSFSYLFSAEYNRNLSSYPPNTDPNVGRGNQDNSMLLDNQTGWLPISLIAYGEAAILNLEIECRRSADSMEQWKLETYNSIMEGYKAQLQAYESALSAAQSQMAFGTARGDSPATNRETEREELKKQALRIICQGNDLPYFTAVREGVQPEGYPDFDLCLAERQGRLLRFLEEAFEWDLMVYDFYPYFWARKPRWAELSRIRDTDPLFNRFLRAGGAQVKLAVRRGYEAAVLHFLQTGQMPQIGQTPSLSDSPLYQAYAAEFMPNSKGEVEPSPNPEPKNTWEINLPTNLVILQNHNARTDTNLFCPL